MPHILRSKNRPGYEQYEPQSITASGPEPELSYAPAEAWELVLQQTTPHKP